MTNKLFVGGISWDTTEESLRAFFAAVGPVTSASIVTDRLSGKSKGFGFVEMGSEQLAQEAIQKLNGQPLDNREITVSEARPQAPRDDNSRGNDRNRGGGGFNRGGGGNRDRRY